MLLLFTPMAQLLIALAVVCHSDVFWFHLTLGACGAACVREIECLVNDLQFDVWKIFANGSTNDWELSLGQRIPLGVAEYSD